MTQDANVMETTATRMEIRGRNWYIQKEKQNHCKVKKSQRHNFFGKTEPWREEKKNKIVVRLGLRNNKITKALHLKMY